jgi:hypothetical protein
MPTVSDVKFELKTRILKNKSVKTWKNPRLDVISSLCTKSYSLRPGITDPFSKKKCPKITDPFQFSIQLSSFPIQYNTK